MSCTVYIDNYRPAFRNGDVIQGRVVCGFKSNLEIRGIRVKLRGKEHTSWLESESYYDSQAKKTKHRTVQYSGDNTFLEQQLTVCAGGNMRRGTLEFPYTFSLPDTLPDSFKNTHGYIEYYIKANVDIPWAPDYEDIKHITLKSPIDFNRIPNICLDQVIYEDEKTLCCWCCASGPITMKLYLEKEAFVITESPRLKVHIVNMSNESIESLSVKIVMTIISKTTSPRAKKKYDKELISSAYDTGVGAHGDRTYDIVLEIPPSTFVPNFNMSSLFEKYVKLSVEAILPGCHQDMKIKNEIVLGHIPMANTVLVNGSYQNPGAATMYPTNADPPPYNESGRPPYPTGQTPRPPPVMGFNVPEGPGPSAPPPVDDAPSAPSKTLLADDEFEVIDENRKNAPTTGPPPSYNDAMRNENTNK